MAASTPPADLPRLPSLTREADTGLYVGRCVLRVRYSETDRMGVAYNGHYLTWFEIGRTEFMRSAGIPYREVEERGHNLPLVGATLRIPLAVRYDDILITETRIAKVRSRAVTFAYRLLHGDVVTAAGDTVHACVEASSGRAQHLPVWLISRLRELGGEDPEE